MSKAEIDPLSEERVGGRRCADECGENEPLDKEDVRDGMEGSVSSAGTVYVVDCDPVEVRDLIEGTERNDGVGDKVPRNGLVNES